MVARFLFHSYMLLLDSKIDILRSLDPMAPVPICVPVPRHGWSRHDVAADTREWKTLVIPESEKTCICPRNLPHWPAGAKHKTIRQFSQISKRCQQESISSRFETFRVLSNKTLATLFLGGVHWVHAECRRMPLPSVERWEAQVFSGQASVLIMIRMKWRKAFAAHFN